MPTSILAVILLAIFFLLLSQEKQANHLSISLIIVHVLIVPIGILCSFNLINQSINARLSLFSLI